MTALKTRPTHASHAGDEVLETPALVWDLDVIDEKADALARFANAHQCLLFYSVKASAVTAVLARISGRVSGFACSSPFEARLAREVLGAKGTVSMTSPALRPSQNDAVDETCDHVTFNSLSQWANMAPVIAGHVQRGLRLNPGNSIVNDPRHDPCRANSKLGIPLPALADSLTREPTAFDDIQGLHIHTACGNQTLAGLVASMELIEDALPGLLDRVSWFNLGGGYAFDKILKTKKFAGTLARLNAKFGLDFIIEPGTAMVQNAGSIVTTVVDIIEHNTATLAVLDTSINHMPEVFAYQFQPPVEGARPGAAYAYILAGATCLAGDLLGSYAFDEPLEIGQRVRVLKMGAYTHGQSHWFNGVNLPTIYSCSKESGLKAERAFGYEDFAARCGATR